MCLLLLVIHQLPVQPKELWATRNPATLKALVLGLFLMATGSFGNISWRQQDGHAVTLLSPQCPPLATALGTGTGRLTLV